MIDARRSGASRRAFPFDEPLLISVGILLLVGLAALHSVDVQQVQANLAVKQAIYAVIGVGIMAALRFTPMERIQAAGGWLYAFNLACLLAVLLFSEARGGAQRWLELGPLQFQPSELSKVVLIITLSAFYVKRREEIRRASTFFLSILHIAPPLLLIILQPHVGGAVSVLVLWLAVSLFAGVPWRYILGLFVVSFSLLGVILATPQITVFDHARDRINAMVNPDPEGNGYHQKQAKIAIANGGLVGTGYMKGDRIKGGHVPEQQNDFIFTVIGEEGGLMACFLLITAFAFFLGRLWLISLNTRSSIGRLITAGVLGVLGFHVVVNIGMNIGLTPVVGLWLPFLSAGGTALWMCFACVGLAMNAAASDEA